MTQNFYLFDMDGVLLKPLGYQKSLQTSVKRIGLALGAPQTELSEDQIAKFEALSITNEWDTLAICTALILIQIWQTNAAIRLDGLSPHSEKISSVSPDFECFLASFTEVSPLPGHSAFQKISTENKWLNTDQQNHLEKILLNCRNIVHSPTLPGHQETVLGSTVYQENYDLKPMLDIESFLLKYDHPMITAKQQDNFRSWLSKSNNHAGIMTNRPSRTPPGYLSSPEAELGAKLVDMEDLPLLGSGLLAWFAVTKCQLPDHTFLKPNPVHALALMQMCTGQTAVSALNKAYSLWRGNGIPEEWLHLKGVKVTIFEDAAKGLQCGITACDLLNTMGFSVDLALVGVTQHPIKMKSLEDLADVIIPDMNHFIWE